MLVFFCLILFLFCLILVLFYLILVLFCLKYIQSVASLEQDSLQPKRLRNEEYKVEHPRGLLRDTVQSWQGTAQPTLEQQQQQDQEQEQGQEKGKIGIAFFSNLSTQ